MSNVNDSRARIMAEVEDLAKSALNARSKFPDYGRTWGPWQEY